MAILKRFEVWMLLLFLTVGIGFVLFTHHAEKNAPDPESDLATIDATEPKPKVPFEIETTKLIQDDAEHWLLELQVRYRNEGSDPLELTAPRAHLKTESGGEVPNFFLALAPPPVVPAEAEQVVDLRYWLNAGHRQEPLWLTILNDRVPVELAEEAGVESATE